MPPQGQASRLSFLIVANTLKWNENYRAGVRGYTKFNTRYNELMSHIHWNVHAGANEAWKVPKPFCMETLSSDWQFWLRDTSHSLFLRHELFWGRNSGSQNVSSKREADTLPKESWKCFNVVRSLFGEGLSLFVDYSYTAEISTSIIIQPQYTHISQITLVNNHS